MDEQFDWRAIFAGVTLGIAAMVIGSVIFSQRRSARSSSSSRLRSFLTRAGILPRARHAHIGPIQVPEVVEGIPDVFLKAFR